MRNSGVQADIANKLRSVWLHLGTVVMAAAKVLQFSIIKLLHLVKRNEAISLPLALFHCLYLLAVKDKK